MLYATGWGGGWGVGGEEWVLPSGSRREPYTWNRGLQPHLLVPYIHPWCTVPTFCPLPYPTIMYVTDLRLLLLNDKKIAHAVIP